ncbi:N-6 DNA methylase [Variovorax guangxiensis]|nr:N-6 DNA methylase [Variovorax guangxiensis]
MAKANLIGPGAHKKELTSLLRDNARRHRLSTVFSDFVELGALAVSNKVDKLQYDKREARYLEIVGRYEREEVERFPIMFGLLADWLACGFSDCLGDLFMSLELGDNFKGQFFTPYSVSSLMAALTIGDATSEVERKGFITFNEPACGSAGMLIACAEALTAQQLDHTRHMHAIAIDIDATAVHMAYLQLSLLGVPAIVIHGNALTLKEYGHWVTPMHVLGGWDCRLRRAEALRQAVELLSAAEPAPVHIEPELAATDPSADEEPEPHHAGASATADAMANATREIVAQRAEQLGLFS